MITLDMITKEKLKKCEWLDWRKTFDVEFDDIIVIITRRKHESDFNIYESYGKVDETYYKIGEHDIIDIDTYTNDGKLGLLSIDSSECGMFRLFSRCYMLKIKYNLSSLTLCRGEKRK